MCWGIISNVGPGVEHSVSCDSPEYVRLQVTTGSPVSRYGPEMAGLFVVHENKYCSIIAEHGFKRREVSF